MNCKLCPSLVNTICRHYSYSLTYCVCRKFAITLTKNKEQTLKHSSSLHDSVGAAGGPRKLYEEVARLAHTEWAANDNVGLVYCLWLCSSAVSVVIAAIAQRKLD